MKQTLRERGRERERGQHWYRVLEYIIDQENWNRVRYSPDLTNAIFIRYSQLFQALSNPNTRKTPAKFLEGLFLRKLKEPSDPPWTVKHQIYLHQLDTCSCHPQHMQENCVLDSIPRCSWQLGMESGGLYAPFEHLTVSTQNKISLMGLVCFSFNFLYQKIEDILWKKEK